MREYKVGDIVKLKDSLYGDDVDTDNCGVTDEMLENAGKIAQICEVYAPNRYRLSFDGFRDTTWQYSASMFDTNYTNEPIKSRYK